METRFCKDCGQEKPLVDFWKNKRGYTHTCKDCVMKTQSRNRTENIAKYKNMALSQFTPRELMDELKRRGYEFQMKFTEVRIIDSKNIEI